MVKGTDLQSFTTASTVLFLRYGDLLAKNYKFLLPFSQSAPSLPKFALEFSGKVNHKKTSHGAILQ